MFVDVPFLQSIDAWDDQVELFAATFPNGCEVTLATLETAQRAGLDLECLGEKAFGYAFDAAMTEADLAYGKALDKACEVFRTAYDAAMAETRPAYDEELDEARWVYEATVLHARAVYDAAIIDVILSLV